MATINAADLSFSFSALLQDSVRHFAFESSSPDQYTWVTGSSGSYYRITAHSADGGIDASTLAGTIDRITVASSGGGTGFSIEGLDVPLASLIDTADPAANHEKFWEAVMAGATTVVMPENGAGFSVMGDYVRVAGTGVSVVSGADVFTGAGTNSGSALVGDAIFVDFGVTFTGGDDVWTKVSAASIVGDVGDPTTAAVSSRGNVQGGDDTVTLTDSGPTPTLKTSYIVGDIWIAGARNIGAKGSVCQGGDDAITLRDIAAARFVVGDAKASYTDIRGGNDDILIETTLAGRPFVTFDRVIGDVDVVSQTSNSSFRPLAYGGSDTVTLNNVVGNIVTGDFFKVQIGVGFGGDDIITIDSTFASSTLGRVDSSVQVVAGDIYSTVVSAVFSGGSDTISLIRTIAPDIVGDVFHDDASEIFSGGDDSISVLYNRVGTSLTGYRIAGDAYTSGARRFEGGDDTIALNVQSAGAGGTFVLIGDVASMSTYPRTFTGGDDSLRVTSNAQQSATLYGDAITISAYDLTLDDGDDTLTGGAGADTIYGDTPSESQPDGGTTVRIGGDDVLDGGGGGDVLYGGSGVDTAVFGLDLAVRVDLKGITGSGGDLYEAAGQGNDQLVGIENVIGSSRGDVITGNAGFNVLEGAGGADSLNGGGGQDTASYVGSIAGVVVNLTNGVTSGGDATGDRLVSIERLLGSAFADSLGGGVDDNRLDGGEGADYLRGYGGNDVYIVDNIGDIVDEAFFGSGGGGDVVRSDVSIDLSDMTHFKGAIENVALLRGAVAATGNGFSNVLAGNSIDNFLNGKLGADTLTGGQGADMFVFDSALGGDNIDTLADFLREDAIHLDDAVFMQLTPGLLSASLFKNTAAGAIDANDRIIYNSGTGALIYDTNGSGAGGATQFAQLGTALGLTNADFVVI